MTREEFDVYCSHLKATTHIVQWGDASVWKVGGKVFAIAPATTTAADNVQVSFKCSPSLYDILQELDSFHPAPYLARGNWIQTKEPDAISDEDLKDYIQQSYQIIVAKLTKAQRKELGLDSLNETK